MLRRQHAETERERKASAAAHRRLSATAAIACQV